MRYALVLVVILLQGCTGALHWQGGPSPRAGLASDGETYTVREGDTLFSIAWRNDLDYRDLAAWNNIEDPSRIRPGQQLSLRPAPGDRSSSQRPPSPSRPSEPAERPSRESPPVQSDSDLQWDWPARGELIGRFGQDDNRGIDISAREGSPVRSAAAGEVVYSGSGLTGYGQLIIIKHTDTYLSAYAHNSRLLVEEGDSVSTGQRIADMGRAPGSDNRPRLHFEIRRNGEPVDPLSRLPEP